MLCGAIGNRGIKILGPFFGLSHLRISDQFTCAMTGAFQHLPVELIQCIATCLLSSRRNTLASARDVRDFVCTCRGAAAAVVREFRLEAAARAYMRDTLTPLPTAPPHRAYTELLFTFVRSHLAYQAMMSTLRDSQSHCAHRVCCSAGRETDNGRFAREDWWRSWGDAGLALLKEALGKEPHLAMRIHVAAAADAQPLCHTERGVAFAQQRPRCPAASMGVLCVESEPCDVYSPYRELKVTFEVPYDRFVALAASSGKWLAVITHPPILPDEVLETPWVGSEHMRKFVDDSQLQVWDMETNKCVYEGEAEPVVHKLWMVGQTVYWFARGYDAVGENLWPLRVGCCTWMQNKVAVYSLGSCGALETYSVARHTGDMVYLDTRGAKQPDLLNFFDAKAMQVRTIDTLDRGDGVGALRSIVALSPTGDVLVALLRCIEHPGVVIYRRSFEALMNVEKRGRLGWGPSRYVHPSSRAEFPRHFDYAYQHAVFSPCGSRAVFFFKDGHHGEVMTVDLRGALAGGRAPKVAIRACNHYHRTMPQDSVAWVDGGIYLPTGAGGGLLRIGTS